MHERDYLERTIATVRNHRGADNCWPQWANIFADEIERLWELGTSSGLDAQRVTFECGHRGYLFPDEYGDGSAWCQACGKFQCYDRCPECFLYDCTGHRETA